jgi:hypothetical protein
MPPKKAAKKAAHDHHKKHDHEKKHDPAKDLRRAYEHLGRVEILRHAMGDSSQEVGGLVELAQDEVANGTSKNAADLLRAAEHLGFAAILDRLGPKAAATGALMAAVDEEFCRLAAKAEEHWESEGAHPAIAQIYRDALTRAAQARSQGAHRQALELVRAAEALAHVKPLHGKHPSKRVAARSNVRELAAS